ncbi:glycosyltransferase [Pontibacillus sp. ALD_SL1]|uniref:glycosyltransferase n=1 Tax=Pontibacillus sp. ALD_SL1 TaxID=2777185 RepID=UPI001A96BBE9|nr:glycosyltransferase [Pontibacillus sp. ALD_SL1]QSS99804.1 glycosyltransferase [Pontibacillus sp. ALD_SL1]
MRVVHLISGGETGGSKNHLLTLLSQFNKEDVSLLVMQKGALYEEALEKGIDVHPLDQSSRYDVRVISKLKRFLKNGGYDLLHTHGPRANLYGALIKRSTNIPWITTIHSDPKLDFLKGGIKGKVFTKINLWAISRIDHFFAVSERFKEDLISLGISGEKITTVYNGIDFSKGSYAKGNLTRKELNLNESDFVASMVARLHPIKGHEEVFQAVKSLQDSSFQLLLVGGGPEEESLKSRVKELGIENQVHFLGFRSDVPDIYQISDVGLLASYSESFPLALLEAGREDTPVIATDVGGVQHMVSDYGWVVPIKDSEALKSAFTRAINKKETGELAPMGRQFHEYASSNFSLEQLAEATEKMYKTFLEA